MARPPIHPGEILADELKELGVTPTELARQIEVPTNRITQIIHGRRGITGDTALRLGHWFGTSAQFWLNLQTAFEIRVAERHVGRQVERLPTRPGVRGASLEPRGTPTRRTPVHHRAPRSTQWTPR